MKLASEFRVPTAPERALTLFLDPETMRACVPGCESLELTDESTFKGRLVNKVAHVRFSAGFQAQILERSESHVRALLKGEDRRLGSSVQVNALLNVVPDTDGGQSLVDYEFDLAIWGKIGRLGESIVRKRTAEVEQQFVERFRAACEEHPLNPGNGDPSAALTQPVGATSGGTRTAADSGEREQGPPPTTPRRGPLGRLRDWLLGRGKGHR